MDTSRLKVADGLALLTNVRDAELAMKIMKARLLAERGVEGCRELIREQNGMFADTTYLDDLLFNAVMCEIERVVGAMRLH